MPAKATKTIKQTLSYQPQHAAWFEQTQPLFNHIAGFYFDVIVAHPCILELSNMEALAALEKLTHATKDHPNPIMPLAELAPAVPATLQRVTRWAPRKIRCLGWRAMHRGIPSSLRDLPSRGNAPHTLKIDYGGVPEAPSL